MIEKNAATDGHEIRWLAWMNAHPRRCLVVCAVLLATQTSSMWYPSADGSRYLSLAKSFSQLESPTMFGDSSIYIAPFYSVMISPLFRLSDRPFLLLSLFEWCTAMVLMAGVYCWAKRACPQWAVLLTCMVVLNHSISFYYRRTLKETLFMALMIWIVNLMHSLLANRSSKVVTVLTAAGVACLMCMLTLTRFLGLVFAIGFSICLLVQAYQRRTGYVRAATLSVCLTAPAMAVLFGWTLFTTNYTHEGYLVAATYPYVDQIQIQTQTTEAKWGLHIRWGVLWDGLRYRISDLSRLLIPGMWKAPALQFDATHIPFLTIYLPVAALCVFGWWRLARERLDVLVYSTPFWFAAYVHSSAEVYGRVFNPLLPVLGISFWYGMRALVNYRRAAAVMALLLALNLSQGMAFWLLFDRPRTVLAQQQWPVVDEMAQFLREHPQPVAISDRVDHQVWLMLQFALDREVQHPLTRRLLQPDAQWFVRLQTDAEDENLQPRFSVGEYVVLAPRMKATADDPRQTQ